MGYGLTNDEAEWWLQYKIWRYGPNHVDSYIFFYSDLLDYIINTSKSFITYKSLKDFIKITINTISPKFDHWIFFYYFMLLYGKDILEFLNKFEMADNSYKTSIIKNFVDVNFYIHLVTFSDLVDLFPNQTINDNQQINLWVSSVIQNNKKIVCDYREGKLGVLNFLKGQVMKLSGGKANPQLVGDLILKNITQDN